MIRTNANTKLATIGEQMDMLVAVRINSVVEPSLNSSF